MVDASDKLNEQLLEEKKQMFKDFVDKAMADLSIYKIEIRFWQAYCPMDTGREIAHIHLDNDPPIICISLQTLKWLPMDEVKDTAIHEVTHIRNPEHDSVLYLTIDSIMEKHWRPPTGVQVTNGNEWIEDEKELPKHKTRKNQCNYHFCHKTKELKACRLCGERFCKEHIHSRPPGMPRFKSSAKEDRIFMEEWRKKGHPCPKYYKDEERPAKRATSFEERQKLRQLQLEMRQKMIESKEQEKLDEIALKKKIPRHWVEAAPERADESKLESTPEEIKRMKEADEVFLKKTKRLEKAEVISKCHLCGRDIFYVSDMHACPRCKKIFCKDHAKLRKHICSKKFSLWQKFKNLFKPVN